MMMCIRESRFSVPTTLTITVATADKVIENAKRLGHIVTYDEVRAGKVRLYGATIRDPKESYAHTELQLEMKISYRHKDRLFV